MKRRRSGMPVRVEKAIAQQQYKSEILVCSVQMIVVAMLSALFLISPAGYSPEAPVKAAPLGLSLFFILSLVRLYFARTQQLTPTIIGFFTVAEMAVLIGTIWAYGPQFEQPALITLKNPAFFYVFILICLRSLRFEAIWVAVSGITAATLWSLLMLYALHTSQDRQLTWDYLTYATTGRIHPGAEMARILSVLVVTAILSLSLSRARRLLVQAASQTQAAADLSLFFDNEVAQQIIRSEGLRAGRGATREAAVMFIDMRGFTSLSASHPPDTLMAILGEYQHILVPIIRSHGGTIDKYLGDGILASFGAVTPSATYAADAFRALDEIMRAGAEWHDKRSRAGLPAPGVGAGLACGRVVFGIIGDGTRLEYTIIGEPVNLAAKLEKHNKQEHSRALASHEAFMLARQQGYAADGLDVRLKRAVAGVTQPIDLVAWG